MHLTPPAHKTTVNVPGQILDPRRKFIRLYPHLTEVPFTGCRTCALFNEPDDCEAAPCSTRHGYSSAIQYTTKE